MKMILTTEFIKKSFEKYNEKYFNGLLVMPNFEVSSARTQLGLCCRRRKPLHKVGNSMNDFYYIIKISNFYDRTEHQYDNCIIHEMIHLYAFQQFPTDKSKHGHGAYFKNWCSRINRDGWELSRCNSMADTDINTNLNKLANKSYLLITLKTNGSYIIARVSPNKLNYFKNWLTTDKRFSEVQFFYSNNSNLFERFRLSQKTLHYKPTTLEEIDTKYLPSATKVFS